MDSKVTWVKWKLASVYFWAYLMEVQGIVGQMKARFGPLEVLLFLTQDRCMVCAKCTIGLEISLDAPNYTPRWCGLNVSLFWSLCEIVLISTQDRCTVYIEHAIGSEIILGIPDRTPRWRGSSGRSLWFAWRQCYSRQDRCMYCAKCTMFMEIISGVPDGTPR
jgi:hypothetical protein